MNEPMSRSDFYAAIRLIEEYCPCDPFVTRIQTKLGNLSNQLHPNNHEVNANTVIECDRLSLDNPSEKEQNKSNRVAMRTLICDIIYMERDLQNRIEKIRTVIQYLAKQILDPADDCYPRD